MAGSLIKVDEFTISSPVASVILGGGSSGSSGLNASIDSTYDVYMVRLNNVKTAIDNRYMAMRFTESGTPNSTANYDYASKLLDATTTFFNESGTNATEMYANTHNLGTGTGEALNSIMYIFNANNSSEYTFMTIETTHLTLTPALKGIQGGTVFTVTSAVDGIQFYLSSSANISSGSFVLYGLKK